MSDKITVNPDSIRGLGDIVSPKILSDFDVFNVKLTAGSAVIDAETLPVFNHNYLPGSKLNDLDYLLCVPTEATTATVSFKLVHVSGATITGATVNITVNDTVVGSCTTNGSGIGSYSIDLTGAFLEDSLFHVRISYEGNTNVSGCFKNIIFWHGDITGLTLTSDAPVVDKDTTSHVLATLSGTNMLGESVGIPGQEVMVFEEYTPGLKIFATDKVSKDESINITAQIIDTEDGSRVSLPGQLINIYEEYTPGITVRPSKAIISNGETITLTGQLIDTADGGHVALEHETVKIYEEYTPGVRITGPKITSDGADDITLTAELYDTTDGSRVCLAGETIDIYEDFHPNVALSSNHEVIETGDSATLTATLLDDDGSAISGETVDIYEEYTPGVMVSSNYKIIETDDTATLTAQLIDTEDGSRVGLSGETITIYQEVDEIFYYVTLHHHEYSENIELLTATVQNQFGDLMSDVLVEFHSSWTGSFTGVRTNSSGNAAIQVRNPIYDNYWFVTLPELYGSNVVADVDLRIPDSDDPVVTTVGLTASSSVISEGSSVTFTAIVKDQNGDVMSDETVTFKEGSTTYGTGTTNSSGVATLTKSGLSVGVHSIMALAGSVNSSLVTVTVNAVPVATSLTLSNTKEILSAYDGDSTVLSATVRDQFDELMSGASVVFKVNGVTKDTVVTDSSGVASYTYAGVGAGDVVFTVECSNLQETYSIEDCIRWDNASSDNTSNYSFNKVVWNSASLTQSFTHDSSELAYKINNANVIGSNGCYYQTVLAEHSNSKFEISMLTKSVASSNNSCDIGFNLVNGTRGNAVYYRVTTGTRRFTKNTSNTSWSHATSLDRGTVCSNIWIKHILTVDNLSFTYKVINVSTEAVLWEYSNTFDSNLSGGDIGIVTGWDKYTHYIKDIKVNPL